MHARPEHRASIRLLPADVLKSKTFIEADRMSVHSASVKVFFYDKNNVQTACFDCILHKLTQGEDVNGNYF